MIDGDSRIGDGLRIEIEHFTLEVARAAADYEIPPITIRAALAYYRNNRRFVDAEIESNAAGTAI